MCHAQASRSEKKKGTDQPTLNSITCPVEPATLAKVEAPLNGRVCGWARLGSYDPALVPEAPIGLIKVDSTNNTCSRCFRVDSRPDEWVGRNDSRARDIHPASAISRHDR